MKAVRPNFATEITKSINDMKQISLIVASTFLLLLTACGGNDKRERSEQTVKIDTVRAAGAETFLQFPGKVKAAQDINLAFRVSGTIRKIYVNEGSRVQAGQLLAELDPTDYQVQLNATEAEYKQIKAEAERVMALYKDGGTTPNANDKAVYGLQQITAKYQHHKDQLNYTRLYAPYSGVIQKRLFQPHETVAAGMPILAMLGAGAPEVEISLPAADYIRRDHFDSYHCTFDVYPGKTYPLKLISISPKANANQLYAMRLQMEIGKKEAVPSPGMNTMVSISCRADESLTFSVPTGALLRKDGKIYLFIYNPTTHTVHSHEVQPLRMESNGRTLISSPQLKLGDLIVSAGSHHVTDGETVKPLPPISETNVGGLL